MPPSPRFQKSSYVHSYTECIPSVSAWCKYASHVWYHMYGMHIRISTTGCIYIEQEYNARDTHVCTYHAVTNTQSNQPPHSPSLMRLAPHEDFLLLPQLQSSMVKRDNTCILQHSIQEKNAKGEHIVKVKSQVPASEFASKYVI